MGTVRNYYSGRDLFVVCTRMGVRKDRMVPGGRSGVGTSRGGSKSIFGSRLQLGMYSFFYEQLHPPGFAFVSLRRESEPKIMRIERFIVVIYKCVVFSAQILRLSFSLFQRSHRRLITHE